MIKSKNKTRNSYTLKFKAMIIVEIKDIGIKLTLKKHYDIKPGTIYKWVKQDKETPGIF
jgi:transposase-like protein